MTESETEDVVTLGSHVIVQKLNYKKVYRVSETGSLNLGKEEIKMGAIIGKPFWTTYKVVGPQEKLNRGHKRNPPSTLVVAEKSESLEDLKKTVTSGFDNRSINDDGSSQKLTKEEILNLRDAGKSGREIVSSLIENNKTFTEKTEYSQEKYIRKKEKKYCQFLMIHKPTITSLHEIYLRQDPTKIYGLRMDTLAQIFSYSDIKAEGTFILYDSGTAGLVAAGLLSRIGANTPGNLVYLHSGDHLPQMPILRGMNFALEQLDRLKIASIFDFLKIYYHKDGVEDKSAIQLENMDVKEIKEIAADDVSVNKAMDVVSNCQDKETGEENICGIANSNDLKRKKSIDVQEGPVMKKSRKVLDVENAVQLLTISKADGLVIIAKEHPLDIIKGLLPFVQTSRPFVIYHTCREPLQETYVALKQQSDVVNLRLFSNFLRSYQILPDRTHPDILMNDCGGYLLTGYTVN